MIIKVDDATINKTTRCEKNFSCLSEKRDDLDLTPLNRSRYNVVVFGLKEKGDLNGEEAFQT
jgi:hypothetical protein